MIDRQQILNELISPNSSKIVLLVMDGIGDIPGEDGLTPLQKANTPKLDELAKQSDLGQTIPVLPGITPGSGPGHLGIFGYDPLKYQIGRGILEALGIDVEVGEKDLVARGNFATLEGDIIVDRRAGRPSSEESAKVVEILNENIHKIEDVEVKFYPGKEHRFVVKLTGEGLYDKLEDADPQKEGKPIKYTKALDESSKKSEKIINILIDRIKEVLKDQQKMNFALLRGFSKYPNLPSFGDVYKLRPAAIAVYPMYKGLAKLVGMEILKTGQTIEDEFKTVKENWEKYDFFYVHVKKTDSYGEDGNFESKVKVIEEVDKNLGLLLELKPDVLIVTGDHSTPCAMKGHSFHPVPLMIYSKFTRKGLSKLYNEFECARGTLGTIPAVDVMSLALAYAGRLEKYGA
ncbi:phosphoglycerate mutase [Thermosipho melanesiensis]|uniref:Probable 2,3-bisphosphoglycerate-independent phosphoglycerate mutase n=2 Tax=Thermosipho melanesiensis TaxID=46541 RepID=APGM_THEM4|nr:2,3-bisphosphoglycerate-independent phosphoglycerate mutase [Thermosipho melanesiensis]A6LMV5.1 RecName: Full=Probable 2,3-bisphosphoglycerate-independent phosphoglycerate mutase; Short=BPG-independent PGAM; Short=Phosphoglyceromutase; Short=aPGAM [Thermosipho melanesiensis BI429]ABR31256.1 phosphonopyruvate decarboxylase-related protein [Thermosipho melanesiensis BI429]APT74340.1 phosphoglycerate mutase [Thermosipho melanesiensis]OOC36279.1 phosphoglycerate mutase [Thermosipho melanesiensis